MNWLDIVIIVIIAVPTLLGLKAGLIKAVLSLAGLVIGVLLAGAFYKTLGAQLTFISSENVANIVGFAIILVGIMIVTGIIASVLKWLVSIIMLGWLNRLGGAVFGFALGGIFCGAVLALAAGFPGTEGIISESTLALILLERFPVIMALLPEEFDAIRSFFR